MESSARPGEGAFSRAVTYTYLVYFRDHFNTSCLNFYISQEILLKCTILKIFKSHVIIIWSQGRVILSSVVLMSPPLHMFMTELLIQWELYWHLGFKNWRKQFSREEGGRPLPVCARPLPGWHVHTQGCKGAEVRCGRCPGSKVKRPSWLCFCNQCMKALHLFSPRVLPFLLPSFSFLFYSSFLPGLFWRSSFLRFSCLSTSFLPPNSIFLSQPSPTPPFSSTAPYFVVQQCVCSPWRPFELLSTDHLPIKKVPTIAGSSTRVTSPTQDLAPWVRPHQRPPKQTTVAWNILIYYNTILCYISSVKIKKNPQTSLHCRLVLCQPHNSFLK